MYFQCSILLLTLVFVLSGAQSIRSISTIQPSLAYDQFVTTRIESKGQLRMIWLDQGLAYQVVSMTLGLSWTRTQWPGKNYLQVSLDKEALALFNGTHILVYEDETLIGEFDSEGDFAINSNGNHSLLLVHRVQNMTWSLIATNGTWSTPVSLNRSGTKPALSSRGNLDWTLSMISSGEEYITMTNGIWTQFIQVSNSSVVPGYFPDLAYSLFIGTIFKISPSKLNRMVGVQVNVSLTVLPNATLEYVDGYFFALSDQLYYAPFIGLVWNNLSLPGDNCQGVGIQGVGLGLFCPPNFYLFIHNYTYITVTSLLEITQSTIFSVSLVINQTLLVGAPIIIQGDLTLTNNSVIRMNSDVLVVQGRIDFAGKLVVLNPVPGPLITYNSSNSTFDHIEIDSCYQVEYTQTQLMVVAACQDQTWMWIVIGVVAASVLIAAIVAMVFFRDRLFPFSKREKWVPHS